LCAAAAVARAGSLVTWQTGQPLKATDLNSNFSTLQAQIAAQAIPPGLVAPFAGTVIPSGWLPCNGAAVSRSAFAALFAAIGTAHGAGDGLASFNVPDYRGLFLRGVDVGAGIDPDANSRTAVNGGNAGDAVGSVQAWATGLPASGFTTTTAGAHSHNVSGSVYMPQRNPTCNGSFPPGTTFFLCPTATDTSGNHTHAVTGGDHETRPANAYVQYIIKY